MRIEDKKIGKIIKNNIFKKIVICTLIRTFLLFIIILSITLFIEGVNSLGGTESFSAYAEITRGPYVQRPTKYSMTIMWKTDVVTRSLVEYGDKFTQIRPDPDEEVILHKVKITGLRPENEYDYRVSVDGSDTFWSDTYTFKAAPNFDSSFRMIVYGDTRTNEDDHIAVIAGLIDSDAELILHVGDLVSRGRELVRWDPQFFTPLKSLMSSVPIVPIIGNHEYSGSGDFLYKEFFELFNNEQWYAFNYGSIRIIGLNTEVSFLPGSTQYDWLVSELQSDNYSAAAWKIIFFHRPPYTSGNHPGNVNIQTHLVPLFEEYGIDMVFAGHVHNYERSFKDKIYYVVSGGGGAPLRGFSSNPLEDNPYSQVRIRTLQHCTLDITPTRLIYNARYNDGTVFDTIIKDKEDTQAPSTPVGLFASLITRASVSLSWNDSFDDIWLGGYEIYRDGEKIAARMDSEYVDTGLIPGTTYVYTIKAYDGVLNLSDFSFPFEVKTLPITPYIVSGSVFIEDEIAAKYNDGNLWEADVIEEFVKEKYGKKERRRKKKYKEQVELEPSRLEHDLLLEGKLAQEAEAMIAYYNKQEKAEKIQAVIDQRKSVDGELLAKDDLQRKIISAQIEADEVSAAMAEAEKLLRQLEN